MKIWKRLMVAALLCAGWSLGLGVAAPANAANDPKMDPLSIDAAGLIKNCWDISEKDRSGSTAQMRKGTLKTVLCLESAIMDIVEIGFEPRAVSRKLAKEWLRDIRYSIGGFYWAIYNEHKGCGWCGTIYQTAHLPEVARVLERILRDMAGHIALYNLEPSAN